MPKQDSFGTLKSLKVGGKSYSYHSLPGLEKAGVGPVGRLPFSLRVLLENLLRHEDGVTVSKKDIEALVAWDPKAKPSKEIQYMPARILLQDFTGVPAVADLAAMRAAMKKLGGDPNKINPHQPADLVIDHSVQVDFYGNSQALAKNAAIEFQRNRERYEFLRWGSTAFKNFRVVPPDTGIVHQINLEYLSHVAMTGEKDGSTYVYPDTLVGTDSHTTMINGLGVLGWGVGGIEAEAAMLGQPISMLIPQVIGFKFTGSLPAGTTATDLVLTVTQMLREKGVVGKFVEFYGPGLANLTLADRATLSNMSPEFGSTCAMFPVDQRTTDYVTLTGRNGQVPLIEAYFKEQQMWFDESATEPAYTDTLELDLGQVGASLAGPSRPQDRVPLAEADTAFAKALPGLKKKDRAGGAQKVENYELKDGSVVIAAITSCTNTSNPAGMVAAGLLAKKAVEKGLQTQPWVKTSLAPGSKVVTRYLETSKLLPHLEALNFHVVGYGCTTCIGNSGPLGDHIVKAIQEGGLVAASVLSGNRNFEGRISPHVRANYLASPALVVAYALAGDININLTKEPLGQGKDGPVFLKDIWPDTAEIDEIVRTSVTQSQFEKGYEGLFDGDKSWKGLKYPKGDLYKWDPKSTYIKEPPFFDGMSKSPPPIADIKSARVLALLKDSVTTDHISPAGSIQANSPAGEYLKSCGVEPRDFNSFGSRRGNHEVMLRGTFGNVRLKNQLAPGTEGGFTRHLPDGKETTIFDASMEYQANQIPLVVLAGNEYGTGSSRDWAAKGTRLLGVKAVIAASFERIHRSNLVGMGVLPLQFPEGQDYTDLGLTGEETFDITGVAGVTPGCKLKVRADSTEFEALVRLDTPNEVEYFKHGGILPFVLRQALKT